METMTQGIQSLQRKGEVRAPLVAGHSVDLVHNRAARVFPDPVGAAISVCRPSRMSGQPSRCGGVGWPNFSANHAPTAG